MESRIQQGCTVTRGPIKLHRFLFPILAVATIVCGASPLAAQPELAEQLRRLTEGAPAEETSEPNNPSQRRPEPESDVRVTDRGTIELHVVEQPLATVLQLLSLDGRWNIVASPRVAGTVTADLFDATFDETLNAILIANDAGYVREGNFIYVYTNDELEQRRLRLDPPATRVFPLNYVSPTDAAEFVTPLLSDVGSLVSSPESGKGVPSSVEDSGGQTHASQDFLIVTDRSAHLKRIGEVLSQIDVRPVQVLVEATILRAQLSENNALGVDFTVVGGVDLELLNSTSNAIQDLTVGPLPQNRFEQFNAAGATDFRDNVPSGGLTLGVIKDHVAVFLRALEEVTETSVLANPKLLALNRQRAQVIVGRRDGYLTTTVTETQAIQAVEFLETGTQLIFRPFVGNDGYIRIELHPEDSVGFVNAQGLPSEQTTEVTTNVLIKDGQTILIGGLFRDVTTKAHSQIPLLGTIPGVGKLFGSTNDTIDREEVIILLSIHIVKDQELLGEAGEALLDDVDQIYVGLRKGLMWTGRERLAERYYQHAVEHHFAGDKDKALWDLNRSLNARPNYLPSLRLKEELTGMQIWGDEGTASRDFLHKMIRRFEGTDGEPFGRPNVETDHDEILGPSGFDDQDR